MLHDSKNVTYFTIFAFTYRNCGIINYTTMNQQKAIELFARFILLCIFYLGIGLCEWSLYISDWHVYSRLIVFYCGWLSYTIKFELPISE